MKPKLLITDLASAVTFLTRLRVPPFLLGETPAGARAAWAYPLAGGIATLLPALVLAGLVGLSTPPLIAALLSVLICVMICGGLHEDGLADTADGLFGGRDRDAMLRIMRDSHSGVFGVVAIVISVFLQAVTLAALVLAYGPIAAGLLYIAGAVAGRACLVLQWSILQSARTDGAAATLGRPGRDGALLAFAVSLFVCTVIGLVTGTVLPVSTALLSAVAAALLLSAFVSRRIGGHTGDTLGATAQVSQIVFLLALVIAA